MFPLLSPYHGSRQEVSPRHNHLPISMQVLDKPSAASSLAGDDSLRSPASGLTPRSVPKQSSLPQSVFRRQAAVDIPARASVANPTIIFSTNNSLDSNPTSTATAPLPTTTTPTGISLKTQQRLRQEKWGKSSKQPSSLNSSVHSNGDVRSFFNRSRKSSLFDLRETTRRKFSIIPQVSLVSYQVSRSHERISFPCFSSSLSRNSDTCSFPSVSFESFVCHSYPRIGS